MEIKDLKNIKREDQSQLYDLTKISFEYRSDVLYQNIQQYVVTKDDEMRLDLVCQNIYGDTDNIDFLMNLNNIKNPLSIKQDMVILYVDPNLIPLFRPEQSESKEVRERINNKRKKTKVDTNRKNFLEEKSQSLPPSVTKKDYRPVKYKDGKIRIGDGIFRV